MMQKPAKNDSGAKRNPNEKGLGRGLKALLGDGTAP